MSDLHIGIITEGPTDTIMLERIARLLLSNGRRVVVTSISPTETELMNKAPKPEGFGWGGVYHVCHGIEQKLKMQEMTGIHYDMIIIHLDGDVCFKTYESANIEPSETDLELPSHDPKKSIEDNCKSLGQVIESWLPADDLGSRIFCIPYINMDIWAAFCRYPQDRDLICESWDEDTLNSFLLKKGKKEGRLIRIKNNRVRKNTMEYRNAAQELSASSWKELCAVMKQAACFERDLEQSMHGFSD